MKHLLPPVTYYKAALHVHSTVSDGKLTPQEARDAYKAKGYSILALTDHSVMVQHQDLNLPDFLMITGSEVDTDDRWAPDGNVRKRQCHLCLLSKDPMRQWIPFQDPYPIPTSVPYQALNEDGGCSREYSPENLNKVIAECNRNGMLVTYNHPVWSLERYPDYGPLKGLWGMEYRNSSCVAHGYDENNGWVYQDFCVQGNRMVPVCADDMHNPVHRTNGYPVLGEGFVMIGAEKLEYNAVFAAMEKGDLYASCGPQINSLTLEGDSLHITCSKAARIQLVSHTRCVSMAHDEQNGITEATFDLARWRKFAAQSEHAFLRLIVTDATGRYAVTRAYFADELTEQ